MLKRSIMSAAMFVLFVSAIVSAADLKDPKEIIKKSTAAILSQNSFSCTIVKSGWDFNMSKTAEATKNLSGEAGGNSLTKRFAGDVEAVDAKPKIMKYTTGLKFMKPYSIKMLIIQSDYLPPILQKAVLTYNSNDKKDTFYIKAKYLFGIPRSVDTESGNFLYSAYHIAYMQMDQFSKVVAPKLEGIEKVDGKDAYKISFNFDKTVRPKMIAPDFKTWSVPAEIQKKFIADIKDFDADKRIGKYVFWFDKTTLLLVKEQLFQLTGEEYWKKEWKDIKLNTLTEKDF